jgi:hypothetical protein
MKWRTRWVRRHGEGVEFGTNRKPNHGSDYPEDEQQLGHTSLNRLLGVGMEADMEPGTAAAERLELARP